MCQLGTSSFLHVSQKPFASGSDQQLTYRLYANHCNHLYNILCKATIINPTIKPNLGEKKYTSVSTAIFQ
ncbi:unknown [Bacteroides sp. CAG:661]|nr:unknown [Bacteroides sp. CAG:661]